jgi:Ca-activated chloride channel homolog
VTLANPEVLGLVAVIPALVLLAWIWDRRSRRQLLAKLGETALMERLTATASPRRRSMKMTLLAIAGALLALALARPQVNGTKEVEIRGLDIVIALDVSTSMLVADVPSTPEMTAHRVDPTRLALARQLIVSLVDALPGDRIGPVVFAAAAAHFPLTDDHEVALQFFSDLGPADLPRGSNIAEALRVARCLLRRDLFDDLGCSRIIGHRGTGGRPLSSDRDSKPRTTPDQVDEIIEREERGRVIIVVSDGCEDLPSAVREVQAGRELGIATVFVGVGSPTGGPVFEIDDDGRRLQPKVDEQGRPIISKRGDAELRTLATAAGDRSRYLVADAGGNPAAIQATLDRVSRGLATKKTKQKRDIFHPFVFAALMLLLIETAISTRRRRRDPEAM